LARGEVMPEFLTDEEMKKLEGSSFISDDEMLRMESDADRYARQTKGLLESTGQAILEGAGTVSRAVDKYTGAPLRAAVGAAQAGKPIGQAFANQYLRDPSTAPSGKEIASRAGISEEEFRTPIITNPFTNERLTVSPAGIAGGVLETALDPTTYLPGIGGAKALSSGSRLVENVAPKASRSLGRFAEERAIKAATGENRAAIRKLAKVKGQSSGDVDRAVANLRKSGRTLLEADEAGGPAVGWLSTSEDIGRNAAGKRKFYGRQIGEVGKTVDELNPEAITGPALAKELESYAGSIPNVGKGAQLRRRLAEESENMTEMGPLSFQQAQEIKAQFPFEPQAADLLISDKDVTNRIHGIVGNAQDRAANIQGPFSRLDRSTVTPSEEQMSALAKYGPAKEKYGTYKNIADAGTEQAMRTLGRRMVSPSSHGIGGATGIAASEATDSLAKGGLYGLGAAIVNQQVLARGSAAAARGADAISRRLMRAPGMYQKWLPTMQKAAAGGNAAVLATHHQLMNSDPDYRRLMTQQSEE
jgi:hypothetical protein